VSDIAWIRGDMTGRCLYWMPDPDDTLAPGYLHHSGGGCVVLRGEDVQQAEGDIDMLSGVVAMRLAECRDGDDDWSDPDGNELEPA